MPVHVSGVALISHRIVRLVGLQQLHLLEGMISVNHEDVLMYPLSLLSLPGMSVELTKQYTMFLFIKQQ